MDFKIKRGKNLDIINDIQEVKKIMDDAITTEKEIQISVRLPNVIESPPFILFFTHEKISNSWYNNTELVLRGKIKIDGKYIYTTLTDEIEDIRGMVICPTTEIVIEQLNKDINWVYIKTLNKQQGRTP